MKRNDMLHLKEPVSLRVASREFGIHYLMLRRWAIEGRIRAQHLGGWFWFVELADVRQVATARKRRRRA